MKTDAHIKSIQFGSRQFNFALHWSDRKRLRIVVSPDLSVDVFAPVSAGDEQVHAAVKKKAPWIAKKLDLMEAFHPLPSPKRYVTGETFVYLGRQYRLKVEEEKRKPTKLSGRFLWICVPEKFDTKIVKQAFDAWNRKRAHETLNRYLQKCHIIASRHGIQEPVLTIRTMQKRWGSCSPKGRITLNIKLTQVPVHCIEYVIMHELCHMKHPNHSKAFYTLLGRCMPDWRTRKATLDRFRIS